MACAFCGGRVERIRDDGKTPFKYCRVECDKAAQSKRLTKAKPAKLDKRCRYPKRPIVEQKYLEDGWWEFWLDCGHGGKLLLGRDHTDWSFLMNCIYCDRKKP